MKHRRLNRTELTATQLQNRKRRRMRDYIMRFGMPTPKGTQPRWGLTGKPVFKPMPAPGFSFLGFFRSILMLMPWMRRRRATAALEDQRLTEMLGKTEALDVDKTQE